MRQRLSSLLVLFLWLLATGVQWDMVQVAGWTRMFAEYSQSMKISEALKKTFSGEMCSVCETVQDAKQASSDAALVGHDKAKVAIHFEATPRFFWAVPSVPSARCAEIVVGSEPRGEPATPPPRA